MTLTVKPDVGKLVVGYGHDLLPGESYPHGIDEAKAESLLLEDTGKWDREIDSLNWDLNQNQHDSLSDFTHNLGIGALHQLAAHGMSQVVGQLPLWCHAKNKEGVKVVVPGLLARRKKEVTLFCTEPD